MNATNRSITCTFKRPRRSPPRRRGVAMMLVVVALAVGTVIAGVALTSRSVAPQLGVNAESASKANWAAQSATDLAVAALQTDLDLSTFTDGAMMSDFTIAGAKVNVVVTDLDGNPPAGDATEVIVTVTATVNGIPSVKSTQVALTPPPTAPVAVDPYLSEFTLFGQQGVTIGAAATVSKWTLSPEAKGSTPIKIGTGFANLASLNINAGARFRDTAMYVDADASASLRTALSDSRFAEGRQIKLDVPARMVSLPSTITSLASGGVQSFTYATGSTIFPNGRKYSGSVMVQDGATLVLDASVSPAYSFMGITVNKSSKLIIRGDVDIEVNGSLYVLDRSLIQVEPGGRADFYVRGNVYTERSSIGTDPSVFDGSGCNPANLAAYADPGSIRILAPTSSYANQTFVADNRSFIVASIHMPATAFSTTNSTALAGRVSAKTINIGSGCRVYADTSLDNRNGYTNFEGALYDDSGNPLSGLTDIISGVLAVLNAGKTAEQFAAQINSTVNATIVAPQAPVDGTTARTARATSIINVPVDSMVLEKRATLVADGEADEESNTRTITVVSADAVR
ncbi:MAG: hypothetical protein H6812_01915 [Phycisphaeraceae bacterium]|nr:hypothetical protein [Phycisphaeraceae bacterium]